MSLPFVVTVTYPDGHSTRVGGRIGRMIAWLTLHADEVEPIPIIQVQFDIANEKISVHRRRIDHVEESPAAITA